jgi:hypothetical protein
MHTNTTPTQTRAVYFDGPLSARHGYDDEHPIWQVFVGDAFANPIRTTYHFQDYLSARAQAVRFAREQGIRLFADAMPA